ncbi:MAG: molybdopterin molybdotransferase MoeA [Candidatus Sericytochromatia bacterium]
MITVDEAEKIILEETKELFDIENINLEKSFSRVLRENIYSDREQPPFDRVAMDGIAIKYESLKNNSFIIQGIQSAGMPPLELTSLDNCIEVMTGAVLPLGCDCVIKVEDLEIKNNIAYLKDDITIDFFQNIHKKGIDHPKNAEVIKEKTKILPTHIAILASVGKHIIKVTKNPSIAIISTGDELVNIEQDVLPHQIRMSNAYAIQSALNSLGYNETKIFHLKDDKVELLDKIANILLKFDTVILSGGVSMGKFDFIPQVMKELEVETLFHKISQKPGKPFWLGKTKDKKLVFGLPGNPVSVLVCFYRYIIPFLIKKSGLDLENKKVILKETYNKFKTSCGVSTPQEEGCGGIAPIPPKTSEHSSEVFSNNKINLTSFLPVNISYDNNGFLVANIVPNNGSGDYYSISKSDGFVEIEKDKKVFEKGSLVKFFSWSF